MPAYDARDGRCSAHSKKERVRHARLPLLELPSHAADHEVHRDQHEMVHAPPRGEATCWLESLLTIPQRVAQFNAGSEAALWRFLETPFDDSKEWPRQIPLRTRMSSGVP